jgi:hypothetical protein
MTIGKTIGTTIGAAAALTVTGAERAFAYSGQFGADLVQGTKDGYADKRAALKAARASIGAVEMTPAKQAEPVVVTRDLVPA